MKYIFIIFISITIMLGCKTNTSKTTENNNVTENKIIEIPEPDDGKSFPLSFRNTWKRDNTKYTITFTKDTLKAENQSYYWILQSVSGDVYTIKPSNYNYNGKITAKIINGNLEISGDSAVDNEHNWNGIWKKQ